MQKGATVFWNVSLIPPDLRIGIMDVLKRDYDYIWDDIKDREDAGYPVVIINDELCWKRDDFVMDALACGAMQVDLVQLAMDKEKQWFRKRLYRRLAYSLKKFCEIWPANLK